MGIKFMFLSKTYYLSKKKKRRVKLISNHFHSLNKYWDEIT